MAISDDFGSCPMALISQEWLYREEFEKYEKEGVLQMHTAFSREQATPDGQDVAISEQVIHESKGVVCVCRTVCPYTWLFVGVDFTGPDQCR